MIKTLTTTILLLLSVWLTHAVLAKPPMSVGKLMQLNNENKELDEKRSLAYIQARQRQVKGLPLSRVKWVKKRNTLVYDINAGTINVVKLNEMLKARVAYINSLPEKGHAE